MVKSQQLWMCWRPGTVGLAMGSSPGPVGLGTNGLGAISNPPIRVFLRTERLNSEVNDQTDSSSCLYDLAMPQIVLGLRNRVI